MKRLILLALLSCGLLACSKKELTREAAEKQIKNSVYFYSLGALNKEIAVGKLSDNCKPVDDEEYLLQLAGLAKITNPKPSLEVIELTKEGEELLHKLNASSRQSFGPCDNQIWTYSLGDPEGVEVTGISQSGVAAEAEFHLRYHLNELGQLHHDQNSLKEKLLSERKYVYPTFFDNGALPEKNMARFKLFDDGWRLIE